jgi:hypothetical protein
VKGSLTMVAVLRRGRSLQGKTPHIAVPHLTASGRSVYWTERIFLRCMMAPEPCQHNFCLRQQHTDTVIYTGRR